MTSEDREKRAGVTSIGGQDTAALGRSGFRRKRFRLFRERLEAVARGRDRIRVLDIGGTVAYWDGLRDLWGDLPLEITIVNIGADDSDEPPYLLRGGDACDLHAFPDDSFDIVHSNSVIEHVGQWPEMARMAAEVRRLAPSHFVQTPNFGFPLEPHYRSLFFHWLPEGKRAAMLTKKRRGHRGPEATFDAAMRNVQSVALVDHNQMKALFPDSKIVRERLFGLTKSLIAVR